MGMIGNMRLYSADGRMRLNYVYFLLCDDGTDLHVRVGASVSPLAMYKKLRSGAPAAPVALAFAGIGTRSTARKAEQELLADMDKWHRGQGWFRLRLEDKAELRAIMRNLFRRYSTESHAVRLEQIDVSAIEAMNRDGTDRYKLQHRGLIKSCADDRK